jgi:hypothetical protein
MPNASPSSTGEADSRRLSTLLSHADTRRSQAIQSEQDALLSLGRDPHPASELRIVHVGLCEHSSAFPELELGFRQRL